MRLSIAMQYKSVSYTHLDVYKRQHFSCTRRDEKNTDVSRMLAALFDRALPCHACSYFHRRLQRKKIIQQIGKLHLYQPYDRRTCGGNHRSLTSVILQILSGSFADSLCAHSYFKDIVKSQLLQRCEKMISRSRRTILTVQRRRRQSHSIAILLDYLKIIRDRSFGTVRAGSNAFSAVNTCLLYTSRCV